MDFSKRIEDLKPYFYGFNIVDNVSIVMVRFPKEWTIIDSNIIKEKFKVVLSQREEGLYFLIETKDGVDNLFNAVEYVININKVIEEKGILLREKSNELCAIFSREPLERLKTLHFTFEEEKPLKSKKKPIKSKKQEEQVEDKLKDVVNDVMNKTESSNVEKKEEQKQKQPDADKMIKKNKQVATKSNSDNMSFIKDIVGE